MQQRGRLAKCRARRPRMWCDFAMEKMATDMPGSNNAFRAKVFVCFPPKSGKFTGDGEILALDWDGTEFTAVFE